jgi:hypothetical protein
MTEWDRYNYLVGTSAEILGAERDCDLPAMSIMVAGSSYGVGAPEPICRDQWFKADGDPTRPWGRAHSGALLARDPADGPWRRVSQDWRPADE